MPLFVKPEKRIVYPISATLSDYIFREDLSWRKGDGDIVSFKRGINISLGDLECLHENLGDFIKFIKDNQ